MPIPERQLETWCNQGAVVTSSQAYASVRAALQHGNSGLTHPNPEVYLQGSYGNSTNIYAESDVDVVVQHNLSFMKDITRLPALQQQAYNAYFAFSNYGNSEHRAEVLRALQRYFGAGSVDPGPKAIKVTTPNGRTVDVIPALEHRQYASFVSSNNQSYVSGISFAETSGRIIVNFPKQHMRNGEAKNHATRTNGRYKQTVRMFKNARSTAIDRGLLADDVAPSYFVECLLYNVPDALFAPNRQQTFQNIWTFLSNQIDTAAAVCQNGQILLFGPGPDQWNVKRAATLLGALRELWNNWE